MIFVIMSSTVGRNQSNRTWQTNAAAYVVSAATAGFAAGASLGLAGSVLSRGAILGLGTALGLSALAVGAIDFTRWRIRLPQIDRETPQRWMHEGALEAAARNGAAMGLGATTRIGFWLWFAVPAGSFLAANPWLGALIYTTYAVGRAVATVMILSLATSSRRGGPAPAAIPDPVGIKLLRYRKTAHAITAWCLVAVGTAALLGLGLRDA